MTRAARTVAKEIADYLDPPKNYLIGGPQIPVEKLNRWLLLLCPPRKSRVRSKGVKARRATVKELDALAREIIFLRDGGKCRRCGKTATDWCHVITRGRHSVRWDMDNAWAGCRGCHMNWWHKQPLEAAEWWKKQIGERRYQELQRRSYNTTGLGHFIAVRRYLEKEKAAL